MTQYQVVKSKDMPSSTHKQKSPRWRPAVFVIALGALIGLGVWVTAGFLKTTDSVTQQSSALTPGQHTQELKRMLRISAASDVTLPNIGSIPEIADEAEPVSCGSRFAHALDEAAMQLYGVDYLSTIGGARLADTRSWRVQQVQAHQSAQALHLLFPSECAPTPPVVYEVEPNLRFADAIGIQHMVKLSDELIDQWSQLYLLAETPAQRELALAGLWQVITWEASWQPGGSPFAFEF